MPFLALVHLRELRCPQCGALLAQAGSRSFVVDERDEPVNFSDKEPPEVMAVAISCPSGHSVSLSVPDEVAAEEALATPDDAPLARDAVLEMP